MAKDRIAVKWYLKFSILIKILHLFMLGGPKKLHIQCNIIEDITEWYVDRK